MRMLKSLSALVLACMGLSFGGAYETSTKLNAFEWDETSHAVWAWLDNPTSGENDKLYQYDWTLPGNSIEKAKVIYSGLLSAYTTGSPVFLFYTTQAVPTTSGWGTIGVIGALRMGEPGPR
jgi:hypothetical protein